MIEDAEIHICTTCPQGRAIAAALGAAAPELVQLLRTHDCLGGCTRRARASVSAPGRWGWLFGNLGPGTVTDLVAFIRAWQADPEGLVPRDRRPRAFRDHILGRLPPPGLGEAFAPQTETTPYPTPVQEGGSR